MRTGIKGKHPTGGLYNRLLAVSAFHFLAIVAIFALVLFVPVLIRMAGEEGYDPSVAKAARDFIALHSNVWPAVLLAFALLLFHDVVVSQRVAGPINRLAHELEAIGGGDLSRQIRTREGDYLRDETVVIDKMVVRLRARVDAIKDAHKSASNALIELEQAADAESRERFDNALRALREDLGSAGAELDQFILIAEDESRGPAPRAEPVREPEPAV